MDTAHKVRYVGKLISCGTFRHKWRDIGEKFSLMVLELRFTDIKLNRAIL